MVIFIFISFHVFPKITESSNDTHELWKFTCFLPNTFVKHCNPHKNTVPIFLILDAVKFRMSSRIDGWYFGVNTDTMEVFTVLFRHYLCDPIFLLEFASLRTFGRLTIFYLWTVRLSHHLTLIVTRPFLKCIQWLVSLSLWLLLRLDYQLLAFL